MNNTHRILNSITETTHIKNMMPQIFQDMTTGLKNKREYKFPMLLKEKDAVVV